MNRWIMEVELTENEKILQKKICDRLKKINDMLENYIIEDEAKKLIEDMGNDAHELHMSLSKRGHKPVHHTYMKKNREMEEDEPDFYKHCLLYTSDAADEEDSVDLGGRR